MEKFLKKILRICIKKSRRLKGMAIDNRRYNGEQCSPIHCECYSLLQCCDIIAIMKPLTVLLQYILPQHLLSKIVGFLAASELHFLKNFLIRWFIKKYNVDVTIIEKTNPFDYKSFQDFFIRKLKSAARPIDSDPKSIIAPVDGIITQMGDIENNLLFQAKGKRYTLEALLAGKNVEYFKNGQYCTIYLSPKDYHRVHMPIKGNLQEMDYVPGKLFSVNWQTAAHIPNLFASNERLINLLNTDIGHVAVIMIGALIVSGIHTAWAGKVHSHQIGSWRYDSNKIMLNRGDEMGYFAFGSTVILLFPQQKIILDEITKLDQPIRIGEKIGVFNFRASEN